MLMEDGPMYYKIVWLDVYEYFYDAKTYKSLLWKFTFHKKLTDMFFDKIVSFIVSHKSTISCLSTFLATGSS